MSTFGHQLTAPSKVAMTREQRHENGPGLSDMSRTGNSKGYYKRNGEYIAVPFSTQSKSTAADRSVSSCKLSRCEDSEGFLLRPLAGRGTRLGPSALLPQTRRSLAAVDCQGPASLVASSAAGSASAGRALPGSRCSADSHAT
jgi:hypothetical protein